MPDYNPDREGHRNHKWIVHKTHFPVDKVRAAGREMNFNREGRFSVSDPGVAAEIRKEYEQKVTVSRVPANHPSDRGHNYHFVCPAMPWHKDKEDKN